MKKFIFRHEKAISRALSFFHILFQTFGLIFTFFITAKGMYGALTNISFPIKSETASSFVEFFYGIWAVITIVFFICSVFFDKDHTNILLEFTRSVVAGFLAEVFFICFIFSTEESNNIFYTFIIFSLLDIPFLIMQRQYEKFIDRAKR